MCTVTVIPVDDGFRLCCNRDERRSRPRARPPAIHHFAHQTAAFPIDPVGPGTWIGVNDAGVATALLNRSVDSRLEPESLEHRSRGLIIPALLDSGSLLTALDAVACLDASAYRLFRLVLVQRMAGAVVTSDGYRLTVVTFDASHPLMFTSSSLGDQLVEGPRRRLFERMVINARGDLRDAQSRFHSHQWRSRPALSVRMERGEARTVSCTSIEVRSHQIQIEYSHLGSPTSIGSRAA